MPDIRFLIEERRNLLGLVLTHAHEDHFGAIIDLWPRLRVPIYATPFTAALFEAKRQSEPGAPEIPVKVVPLGSRFTLGAFDVELVSMSHSIPESNGLIIRTPLGTVLHTGDWKLDPDAGDRTADRRGEAARARRGGLPRARRRLRPMRCARAARRRRSDVAKSLAELIANSPGRVAVTTFASNVARLRAVADAATACDREVVVVGRAMDRIVAGRARDRLSRRRAGVSRHRRLRLSAARQGGGAVHRQPGRAARRARAHRQGRASRRDPVAGRPRDLLVAHHSRATRRRSAPSSTAWSTRASR